MHIWGNTMTEKRFKLIGDSNLEYLMQDELELPIYDYNNKKRLSLKNTFDVLNQLLDENEQLKQDIENLKITIKARETLINVCEKKFRELGYIITVDDDGYVIE